MNSENVVTISSSDSNLGDVSAASGDEVYGTIVVQSGKPTQQSVTGSKIQGLVQLERQRPSVSPVAQDGMNLFSKLPSCSSLSYLNFEPN